VGPAVSFGEVYSRVLSEMGVSLDASRLQRGISETADEIDGEIPPGIDRYAHVPGGEAEYWLRFSARVLSKASDSAVASEAPANTVARLRDAFRDPAAWVVFPDVRPALKALTRDGVRLGVVSNWDSRLPEVLEMLKLADYFEEIGVSHLAGVEKPDPALFHGVLDSMDATPSQALHVGDVPRLDLEGARAAGVDGLLVDRHGRLDSDYRAVRDLSTLPEIARHGLPDALRS
jgi:putative hydrolase of the HAD superfamily